MERRRHSRQKVRYVPRRGPVLGEVLDLSVEGMKVEIFDALAVGSKRTFVLGEQGRHVRIRGLVRWCRLAGTRLVGRGEEGAVYLAGIVFLGLGDELPAELIG